MSRYAARTEVSPEKSKAEIEATLKRYGATSFAHGWSSESATLLFEANGRRVRFDLPLPTEADRDVAFTPGGKRRNKSEIQRAKEQATRQRYRSLLLVIKAKLEAIESGLVTFEEEFLSHIVVPTGETVGQWIGPQLDTVYERGEMPALLPGLESEEDRS